MYIHNGCLFYFTVVLFKKGAANWVKCFHPSHFVLHYDERFFFFSLSVQMGIIFAMVIHLPLKKYTMLLFTSTV